MSMTRKDFIKSASFITGGVLFGYKNVFSTTSLRLAPGFKELRNNVGIYTEKGGTMGWYFSGDSSVVIDTQFPDTAEHFMDEFRKKTPGNIDRLFNTHHHRDHTSGNFYLKQFADKIIAHENCPKLQVKQNRDTENKAKQVYADTTFKTTWEEAIGEETVSARYFGPAHTGGDSVIYFEEANIAHLGDLVFNEVYPKIDLPGGGSIEGWIDVLESAAKRYSSDTLYIFGHAASEEMVTGEKADINRMRDYLTALMDYVKKHTSAGKSIDEVKKSEFIPPFKGRKANWEGALAENIQAAYDEITGKKF